MVHAFLLFFRRHSRLIVRILAGLIVVYELSIVYSSIIVPIYTPPPVESAAVTARKTHLNTTLEDQIFSALDDKESVDIVYTQVKNPFTLSGN